MALIYVYNGVGKDCDIYNNDGKICNIVKGIDLEKSLIISKGEKLKADYVAKKDDVIFIRRLPKDPVTAIVVGGAAILGFCAFGTALEQKNKNDKMQAEMDKQAAAAKAAAETRAKLPFVKGSKNQIATGNTLPFIIGKTLMTPYLLSSPFYTFGGANGSKSYYNAVLEIGYAKTAINKISLGTTDLKSWADGKLSGTATIAEGTYGDSETRVEIIQNGSFTLDSRFNEKWVSNELNTEIPHRYFDGSDADEGKEIQEEWEAGVVENLPEHAMQVEVVVLLDGCRKYDDGWKNQDITLTVEYCTDASNPVWERFSKGFNQNGTYSNTFSYRTKKQMRFVATQTFTAEQAFGSNMAVRVKRTTAKAESNANDTIYLLAVQTKCYDAKKSSKSALVAAKPLEDNLAGKCTRIALRMIANTNTKDNLDAFNVTCTSYARTWNGTSWSTEKTPTRNLASWVLEILTSDTHLPSKYEDSELDLDSFGAFYEYCKSNNFYADGAILDGTTKKNTIETLLQNANAALVYDPSTGKIEVVIDSARSYAVALLNSDNIISFQMSKEFKRQTDGRRCTYLNSNAEYSSDTKTFMRDGGDYDPATDTLTKLSRDYITTQDHIFKYAWREMAAESAQPRTMTVNVGPVGAYYPIFDCVDVQHKALAIGLGSTTIKSAEYSGGVLSKINLDGFVDFPTDSACGIIVNACAGTERGVLYLKVSNAEDTARTHTLKVTSPVSISDSVLPGHGDTISFGRLDTDGEFTQIRSRMKIMDAEPNGRNYILTLKDYVPEMYKYGTIPAYTSNVTNRPNKTGGTTDQSNILDGVIKAAEQAAKTGGSDAAQEAVNAMTHGNHFTNVHKIDFDGTSIDTILAKIDEVLKTANSMTEIKDEDMTVVMDDANMNISTLKQTATEILATVATKADKLELKEANANISTLQSTVSIQSSYVGAMVRGGGAEGHMSLSLELPVVIDSDTRKKMVAISSETVVAAVYAQLVDASGTAIKGSYAIKADPAEESLKALWNACVKGGLLASQIELDAKQVVFSNNGTSTSIIEGGKIKTDLIDVKEIFSKEITLKSDGVIKSEVFNNIQGFELSADGVFECYNGKFNGAIDSGPLKLSSKVSSTLTLAYSTGKLIQEIYEELSKKGLRDALYQCTGTYNNTKFSTIEISTSGNISSTTYERIYNIKQYKGLGYTDYSYKVDIYKKETYYSKKYSLKLGDTTITGTNNSTIYTYVRTESKGSRQKPTATSIPTNTINKTGTLSANLNIVIDSSGQTFRLINLPLEAFSGAPTGTVYIENGFLKIIQ